MENNSPIEDEYLTIIYIKVDKPLQRYMLLNNATVSVLFLEEDRKYHVASLPNIVLEIEIYTTTYLNMSEGIPIKFRYKALIVIQTLVVVDELPKDFIGTINTSAYNE